MIAGAEAARGTLSGMKLRDVPALAAEHYDTDLTRAATALIRAEVPGTYDARGDLATLEVFAVWWAAALARRVESRRIDSGKFFASPEHKGIGTLTDHTALYDHFRDDALQEAVFMSLEQLTGTSMDSHTRDAIAAS